MGLLMPDKVRTVSEGFFTFVTCIGFIPTTNLLIHYQVSGLEQGFPTLLAFTGVASNMNSLVLKQVFDAVKGFPEFIIFVEFFSHPRLLLSIEENVKTKDCITFIDILPQLNCG